jgi:hypothetical protein
MLGFSFILILLCYFISICGQLRTDLIDGSIDSGVNDYRRSYGGYLGMNPGRHHYGRSYGQLEKLTTKTSIDKLFSSISISISISILSLILLKFNEKFDSNTLVNALQLIEFYLLDRT